MHSLLCLGWEIKIQYLHVFMYIQITLYDIIFFFHYYWIILNPIKTNKLSFYFIWKEIFLLRFDFANKRIHSCQKIFYNRERIPFIRIGWNSIHFIMIDWDPWIKKGVNYCSCIESKVVWSTFNVFLNSTRPLFLYCKISIFMSLPFLFWYNRDYVYWNVLLTINSYHFDPALNLMVKN